MSEMYRAPNWVEIFDELNLASYDEFRKMPDTARKVLVVCAGGNVRSVAIAFLLKYKYGVDALSASIEKNSEGTIAMLCSWAERILVVELSLAQYIPVASHEKIRFINIGPDIWGEPFNSELVSKADTLLGEIDLFETKLVAQ